MANTNAPFGFRPAKAPAGHQYTNEYKTQNSTQLLEGDLVTLSADGFIDKADSSSNQILGAVAASDPASPDSSVERKVKVYDDPNQLFEAQVNADTASEFAQTDIGERFGLSNDSSAASGIVSDQVIDTESGASSTKALLVTALSPTQGNEFGAYGKALVKIMNHQYGDL